MSNIRQLFPDEPIPAPEILEEVCVTKREYEELMSHYDDMRTAIKAIDDALSYTNIPSDQEEDIRTRLSRMLHQSREALAVLWFQHGSFWR